MNYNATHDAAISKARQIAETARPPRNDYEYWNNDYTAEMITIIRGPSFMNKATFFTDALTEDDREFCIRYIEKSGAL